MFDKVSEFKSITENMFEVYKRKNHDYGDSVGETFNHFGIVSFLVRMEDKINRLRSIYKKGEIKVKDESVEDTIQDLSVYSILALIELRKEKQLLELAKTQKEIDSNNPYIAILKQ